MIDPTLPMRLAGMLVLTGLLLATSAQAARVAISLDGVEGDLRNAALAAAELNQYANREVSRAQIRRLYRRAQTQIPTALEPYGYYNVQVTGELANEGEQFTATLHVELGSPVKIEALDLQIEGLDKALRGITAARQAFSPHVGQRLDHAAYERSKAAIHAALFAAGYLDATLAVHRVEVERASNVASIALKWKAGQRYRFAETGFEGGQFDEAFMQRFIPWQVGDYYSQEKLLELQQRLFDANYFAISQRCGSGCCSGSVFGAVSRIARNRD
jgi:translocation and assembly module TamA